MDTSETAQSKSPSGKSVATKNAVESVLPGLTAEDKQRIEGMSDDDAEAEVKRLNKATTRPRMMHVSTDSQTKDDNAATPPRTNRPDDDNAGDDCAIGAETVSRALNRTGIEASTSERRAIRERDRAPAAQ
jgi:hypothetical protein